MERCNKPRNSRESNSERHKQKLTRQRTNAAIPTQRSSVELSIISRNSGSIKKGFQSCISKAPYIDAPAITKTKAATTKPIKRFLYTTSVYTRGLVTMNELQLTNRSVIQDLSTWLCIRHLLGMESRRTAGRNHHISFFLVGAGGQGFFSCPLSAWDRLYFATSGYDRSGEWNLCSR
jgi:hypothetical protein